MNAPDGKKGATLPLKGKLVGRKSSRMGIGRARRSEAVEVDQAFVAKVDDMITLIDQSISRVRDWASSRS